MKKNYLLALLLITTAAMSQKTLLKKTDSAFENLAYMDVVKIYEKAVQKGYGTPEIYLKLGDAYYFNADYPMANKWYAKAMETESPVSPEYCFRYAQSLKSVGELQKANEYLKKFSELKSGDSRGIRFNEQTGASFSNHDEYILKDAGINTEYSEYGTAFWNGNLVFTSSRKDQNRTTQIHQWTNQPFTDLFLSEAITENQPGTVLNFDAVINSKLNESTAVFTKDGATAYFTRNSSNEGKKDRNGTKNSYLRIYKATFRNGKWDNTIELPFNGSGFNCAHPALSGDENKLYFASDRPGTLGQSDIYVVTIHENGTYSDPVNLGKTINTEGRESFPYITRNGDLCFASDGHPGMGGLDLFKAVKNTGDDSFSDAFSLGTPFNSNHDDFAYTEAPDGKCGYIASNRPGGKGYDDIYRFTKKTDTNSSGKQLTGQITNRETGRGISGAVVTVFSKDYEKIRSLTTDEKGNYQDSAAISETEFFLRTEAREYQTQEQYFHSDKDSESFIYNTTLIGTHYNIETGKDLAKAFEIENIYFDLDKWEITKRAEEKLGILLVILQEFPTVNLEIRSHTDSRASETYNLTLSEKRASATSEWLVKKGISGKRLRYKGLGETQLLNNCKTGTQCSEEEHSINRRSEFIITSK
ncbi:hypothetical protein FLJC2902T_30620 [Flavobacterium limnosediminis JC2902]|uniref:OmpA-like domain-containing protein n=1 Tax=Flavobacterium limnosediminis JC2902 TaxID=1341181 RepID=V6SH59_9FLAO|nr:OmpA family protein [Flavobacterium limnosediminis]ESU25779.1 hypothetical protein FLJC2902T_30620 [Flavobacterium limnosediminis JC2902]